jgi:hypothetical protein
MPDRRALLLGALTLFSGATSAPARAQGEPLPTPRGEVVLTVTGTIGRTNAAGEARFDRSMLEALGLRSLVTWTPWTDGEIAFEGVPGRDVIAAVEAHGREVRASALDDYECTIPLVDFERYDVLLALRMNGRQLAVRDKGPIWIVYPWSTHPELDDQATRRRSVWQLATLHVS